MSAEVRGTSGQRITPGDVAACMVHVDRHTYLYALSKYCLDDNSRRELNDLAVFAVKNLGYTLTENEPENAIDRLGLMALSFAISPSRCRHCKGTGQVKVGSKVEVCQRCSGTGNMSISVRRLSEAMGVGRWRAQKVWLPRFQRLLSDYQVRDDAVQRVIYRGLKDG